MKGLFLAGALVALPAFAVEPPGQSYTGPGQLLVTQFVSAPFPHPSRAEGWKYQGDFFPADKHYADRTVAIFIPPGFRATGPIDLVIHFHGWRNTVAGTLTQFKLIEQFVASGKNAVLIVPEGPRDAPDSGGGKLEDAGGFQCFVAEVVAGLKQHGGFTNDPVVGGIILSGHSGGHRVISSILERGGLTAQVKEVWLFDALYGQSEKFLTWAGRTGGRLLNIYTDGGGTKICTEEMLTALRRRGTNLLATTDQLVTSAALATNRFVFLHTDLGHDDVLEKRKTFLRFLQTSFLKNIETD